MGFGEDDAAGVLRGEVVRDHVLHERDLSTGIALLLEPREPEHVRLQRRHDVVEPVAVDVVHAHLGAAGRAAAVLTAEGLGMIRPHLGRGLRRLLPPPVHVKDVDAAIAVDVAGADAVRRVRARLANLRREPGPGRICRIGLRPSHRAPARIHEIGLAVGVDVLHHRHFRDVGRRRHDARVRIPAPRLAFRIHVQPRARSRRQQHVGPAVAGEVAGELEPVGREARRRVGGERQVELARLREIRSQEDEGSRDDVHVAVAIEIGGARRERVVERREPQHAVVGRQLFLDARA